MLEKHLARHAPIEGSPFTALNTAFCVRAAWSTSRADIDLTGPVHLVFVTTPAAAGTVTHPRNLIVVERGVASVGNRELRDAGAGRSYWTNPVTEVAAGAGCLDRAHPDPAGERAGLSRRR